MEGGKLFDSGGHNSTRYNLKPMRLLREALIDQELAGIMNSSPWGSIFDNCKEESVNWIRAPGEDRISKGPTVTLTAIDQQPSVAFVSFSSIFVFPDQLDHQALVRGAEIWAAKYPIFAGRYVSLHVFCDLTLLSLFFLLNQS